MMNEKLISIVIGLIFTSYADAYAINADNIKLGLSWGKFARNVEAAPSHLNAGEVDDRFNFRWKGLGLLGESETKRPGKDLVIESNVVHLGHGIFVRQTTSVPEPGSVVLFVLGLSQYFDIQTLIYQKK